MGNRSLKKYLYDIQQVNALDAPDNMDVDMGASYELMWDNILKFSYHVVPYTTSVSLGFGMTWRNYRMTGRTRFIQEGDNLVLGDFRKEPKSSSPV